MSAKLGLDLTDPHAENLPVALGLIPDTRVETPLTTLSITANTKACSLR